MKIVISETLEFVGGKDEIALDACTKLYVSHGRIYVRLHMHPAKFRLFLTHDLVRAVLILTRYSIQQVPARKRPSGKISILNSSTILWCSPLMRAPSPEGWKLSKTLAVSIRIDRWKRRPISSSRLNGEQVPFSLAFPRRHYENGRYFSKCPQNEIMVLSLLFIRKPFLR